MMPYDYSSPNMSPAQLRQELERLREISILSRLSPTDTNVERAYKSLRPMVMQMTALPEAQYDLDTGKHRETGEQPSLDVLRRSFARLYHNLTTRGLA